MPATAIALHDLVLRRNGWSCAVPRLEMVPGRSTALVGPSGCGKSSVLLEVLGLGSAERVGGRVERPGDTGTPGSEAHRTWLRESVGVVLQDAFGALDPFEPVGRQLLAAVRGVDMDAMLEILARLDIDCERARALLDRRVYEISGGEAQRCLLAVTLARRPRWVVVDEPGANLDGASLEMVLERLRELADGGAALLIATHDERVVRGLGAAVLAWDGRCFAPRAGAASRDWSGVRRGRDPAPADAKVLELRSISVELAGGNVLDGVDLTLRRGEIVAVVGASGVGKSTLARVAAGQLRPDRGDRSSPARRAAVQMIFQDARGSLTPGLPALDLIREVAVEGFDPLTMAARLGLTEAQLRRTGAELSGGECRRVALLRALAVEPEVLVCDEPLASLDVATMRAVTAAMLDVQAGTGAAMLVFSHDRPWCDAIADRVYELKGGRLTPCHRS